MKHLEQTILEYLRERGWDTMRPSDMAKSISIESAELLELFQWDNNTLEDTKLDGKRMGEIKKELADVFIYALDMSVLLGLDTEKIILDKLALVRKKYPAHKMATEQALSHKRYLQIKKKHRTKK